MSTSIDDFKEMRSNPSEAPVDTQNILSSVSTNKDSRMQTQMDDCEVTALSSPNPLRNTNGAPFDRYDRATIAIGNEKYHGMNGTSQGRSKDQWLYFTEIGHAESGIAVLLVTSHGIVKGNSLSSMSSVRLKGSTHYREMWTIETEKFLGMYGRYENKI